MKLLTDWGFSAESWQGQRGEYWFLMQVLLMLGFVLLPVYRLPGWNAGLNPPVVYGIWAMVAVLDIASIIFLVKGLLDLGQNLTPLPHPKDEGELVQSGIYGVVRHPIYTGVILIAIAWALSQLSLSHAIAAFVLFFFLDAKARKEEAWLSQKHPDYKDYQQRVKKFFPGIF